MLYNQLPLGWRLFLVLLGPLLYFRQVRQFILTFKAEKPATTYRVEPERGDESCERGQLPSLIFNNNLPENNRRIVGNDLNLDMI